MSLALSDNLLAAERENGTLVMIQVQPVRLSTPVLGKTLVQGAAVLGLAAVLSVTDDLGQMASRAARGLIGCACGSRCVGAFRWPRRP